LWNWELGIVELGIGELGVAQDSMGLVFQSLPARNFLVKKARLYQEERVKNKMTIHILYPNVRVMSTTEPRSAKSRSAIFPAAPNGVRRYVFIARVGVFT